VVACVGRLALLNNLWIYELTNAIIDWFLEG